MCGLDIIVRSFLLLFSDCELKQLVPTVRPTSLSVVHRLL